MTLPAKIYAARDLLSAAIDEAAGIDPVPQPGPGIAPPAPVADAWWRPADTSSDLQPDLFPPWDDTEATALSYAGHGIRPNGELGLGSLVDLEAARVDCDRLQEGYVPREDILAGADFVSLRTAQYARMTGQTRLGDSGLAGGLALDFGPGTSLAEAIKRAGGTGSTASVAKP